MNVNCLSELRMNETVVLIHGIWMTGVELLPLAARLSRAGYPARLFHYHSLLRTPADNAARLDAFLRGIDADVIHLVAHSLGGIVVCHLFDRYPTQRPGRVIMLGTPLRGSAVARRYHRLWLTRPLLGRSTVRGLLGDAPCWSGARRLCMIAGNRGIGIGRLLPGEPLGPGDGTVALAETRHPAVSRHLEVPFSHFGMLFSRAVADAVVRCLTDGDF